MRILIAGGAGFIGSNLAFLFKEAHPTALVVVFDNLRRRGGEFNLPLFRERGIDFVHGDIRYPADIAALEGQFDVLVEASAEPSVLAGLDDSGPGYVFDTNLTGALNCLEFARKRAGCFVFLSTSRVYAMEPLRALKLEEQEERFELAPEQSVPGASTQGIAEGFPTDGARSFYGTSKLAAELLVQEYAHAYNFPAVINRCSLAAGPGQWGKTDQGVLTFWIARHYFGLPLRYIGFGGSGKQVRDMMHPRDLFALLQLQIEGIKSGCPSAYNVGGGLDHSVSLRQWTQLSQMATGREVPVTGEPNTSPVDVPYYTSDSSRVSAEFSWKPNFTPQDIAKDIAQWLVANEAALRPFFLA